MMGRIAAFVGALAAGLVAGLPARAQTFPASPVHFVVPFAAGGAVDILARTLGAEMSARWGQPVIIENRPGAGGIIASQVVAGAKPDGYTLLVVANGHAINQFIYDKLPYDTAKDFTPISLIGSSPNVMIVAADSPIRSLADVMKAEKEKPGDLSFGTAGIGTSTHLAGELLNYQTGMKLKAVPYKGGTLAINDLLGGHIPLSINAMAECLGLIKAGKLRAIGVTTAARSALLPDVPSIAEAGVKDFDIPVWWGLVGPAGMPSDLTDKIAKDSAAAANAASVKTTLGQLGATVAGSSPADFAKLIQADSARWGPVIKAAGIKAE